eukprot:NODE_230_length_12188_cov_0.969890.p5 type:complete len:268 gc:universal NODE_230_length_12188_cov_0.969890:12067-11264(-)
MFRFSFAKLHVNADIARLSVSNFPLPYELQKLACYTLKETLDVNLDPQENEITADFKINALEGRNYIKMLHKWSRLNHYDVLRHSGFKILPFYPTYNPAKFNINTKNYLSIFENYLVPPNFSAFRLVPSDLRTPLVVGSLSRRSYNSTDTESFKVFVQKSLRDIIHYDAGNYTWKIESGYAIHFQESKLIPKDIPEIGSVEQLRTYSGLTIFQPFNVIEDCSSNDSPIRSYCYIAGQNQDFRLTLFESKKPCVYDVFDILDSDILQN